MKKIIALTGITGVLILAGCRSSQITSSWKASDVTSLHYNKVLVLGLIRENDRRLQQKMEDHMAGDLTGIGYSAVSSLEVFGPKAFSGMTEKQSLTSLGEKRVDAVVTIVLLNKTQEKVFVPQAGYSRDRFWDYYGAVQDRIYSAGYWVTDTKYFWESNFYDVKSGKLLYSVQTTTFDADNRESLAHEYGKMIINDMVNKQVIEKQTVAPAKAF